MRDRHPKGARGALIRVSIGRRRALAWTLLPAAQALVPRAWAQAARIASARVWPAQEYTRVILESPAPLAWQVITLKDPDRVVLDLDGVDIGPEVAGLAQRVQAGDPNLAGIRYGRKTPTVLRIVFDLKAGVVAQAFALKPVAEFGHRLVVDLIPLAPPDPLMALLDADRAKPEPAPAEAREPAAREEPRQRRDAARRVIVAIDPGHGGEDPGAVGPRGTYEKNVTLAISRRLRTALDATPNLRAVLTRDDDYFVPLASRVQKARRAQADLFVSIHADAFREARARGSSVFALSENGATSAAARWLAQKENDADLIGGVNLDVRDPVLARTLLDLSQTAQINDSLKAGRHVLAELSGLGALHKRDVEQAGFAVLKAPDVPSILVETAFISNPDEEQRLRDPRHQGRYAESIADGIRRYFSRNPPLARG
ncbi:MAG TPA: N-acetylmuramoyl-L-alanine amidase [Casimicrobiaceae bacterium]|jgi:N-acetylmuramoyl-L-alanine amidase|nr:N-acetylmuramoyl-L-alanine amidase [Casimicrobiaceae bacterium]